MSIIPVIVRRRKEIVEKFITSHAVSSDSAKTLKEIGLEPSKDVEFLVFKGTLVEAGKDKYYLNEEKKFFK